MTEVLAASNTEVTKLLAIDFFCGAGGITRGFLDAGIDVACGIDTDATAKKTYETNNIRPCHCSSVFLNKSIASLIRGELDEYIGNRDGKNLVFIGCAPCQPFTELNTDKTNQGDSRNLLLAFLECVREYIPEYVLIENVPGIQDAKYGNVFQHFIDGLHALSYKIDYKVIDAKKYGVPQTRERMALLASWLDPITIPKETHGPGKLPYVPASIAFRFPSIAAGETHKIVANHKASSLTDINLKRIRAITRPGGSRDQWPPEYQLECYKKLKSGYEDVYGRMSLTTPAPTLTTKFNSISNGRFGHPTEDRGLSLREGADLQTFREDYIFYSCIKHTARHIGNAVPVDLANVLAVQIRNHFYNQQRLERENKERRGEERGFSVTNSLTSCEAMDSGTI